MIKPVLHRILIKVDPVETKTASGIIVSLNEKREQAAAEIGTVVDIGSTAFKDYGETPDLVKIGDRVYFAKYAGKLVKDTNEDEFLLVNDEDICGLLVDG